MKVVFATDNYWPRVSGMAVSIDTFSEALSARGHEVHLLAPDYPGARALDAGRTDLTVHRFDAMGLFFTSEDRLVRPSAARDVWAMLDVLKPDVVHTHTEMLMCRPAWRWAKARGVPLVMTAHTHWEEYINNYIPFPPPFGRALVRFIMRRVLEVADVVIAPGESLRQVLLGYGVQRPIEVLPTGFQHSAFEGMDRAVAKVSSPLFAKHPELKGRTILLSVGRVAQEKNLGLVLDAVERLVPTVPDLTWLVVGDGPGLKPLRKAVRRRGLMAHVVTPGYLDRQTVKHAFELADVFCLASTTESQGLVTVEALASGLPVVGVDAMGTREVLANEQGGLLCPNDSGAFAECVKELLSDELLYRRKSREARANAERFSPDALAQRLLDIYRGIMTPAGVRDDETGVAHLPGPRKVSPGARPASVVAP